MFTALVGLRPAERFHRRKRANPMFRLTVEPGLDLFGNREPGTADRNHPFPTGTTRSRFSIPGHLSGASRNFSPASSPNIAGRSVQSFAAGREVRFAYDDAGRVTAQTFLDDGRVVGFDYDNNGNPTQLDVPSDSPPAPRHEFAYTPVNLESAYTPPDSNWPGDAAAAPTSYFVSVR